MPVMIDVSQFYSLKMVFFFFFWGCFHSHSIGGDFGIFRNLGFISMAQIFSKGDSWMALERERNGLGNPVRAARLPEKNEPWEWRVFFFFPLTGLLELCYKT